MPECHAVKRQFLANPEHHLAIDVSVVARMTGVLAFEMKFLISTDDFALFSCNEIR